MPDFFVVSGPVPADRACYIRREADEALIAAIADERFASVLAPRAMGKSSLMGRTIRRLRADGQQAAVVDFSQIGSRGDSIDAARWHYSIAHRISRELRLRVDLQSWWQDRTLLSNEQRLVEFFQDVVLGNTEGPVTLFFDEVERAVELPFAHELYVAIYGSLMRRASEPDFSRLHFVVLGAATPEQLCPDAAVSPFVGGRAIALRDFTRAECAGLATGFGRSGAEIELVLSRIYSWTRGQPLLTQKLARAVARRGGRSEHVDAVLHELFLGPGMASEEPLLNHVRRLLTDGTLRARQAVSILGRLSRSQEVIQDATAPAQQLLNLLGLIGSDENGMLRYRNPIVEQVFGEDFVREQTPRHWQRPAAIAAAAAVVFLLLPFWYLRVLPADAMTTLRESTDYTQVEGAHARLSRLPGFGGSADRLLGEAMQRRGAAAGSMAELRAAEAVMRRLPDGAAVADALVADYWRREAEAAASRGERDAAIILALAAVGSGSQAASGLAENLIDGDYRRLGGSLRFAARPLDFAVDWERNEAVVVDVTHRVHFMPLARAGADGSPAPGAGSPEQATRLTALQQVGITRSLFVDTPSRGGAFELALTLEHDRRADLLLRLRAPNGRAAEIGLPATATPLVIQATAQNGLRELAADSVTGQWELSLFDREIGETGRLMSWSLRFSGATDAYVDAPAGGLPLPDPQRTEQVDVVLSADGRLAVATPSRADVRGFASLWDLNAGERIADLPLPDDRSSVELVGGRVLVAGAQGIALWDARAAEPLFTLGVEDGFLAPPAISADGRYLAVAESTRDGARVSLIDIAAAARIGRFETGTLTAFALAPDAAWLAVVDGSRRGRVLDARTGDVLSQFFHEHALTSVVAGASNRVIAVDEQRAIVSWPLGDGRGALGPQDAELLGETSLPASIAVAESGAALAYLDADGFIAVLDPASGLHHQSLAHGDLAGLRVALSPAGDRLVSFSDSLLRYWDLGATPAAGPDFGSVSAVALDASGKLGVLGLRGGQVGLLPGLPAAASSGRPNEAILGHRGSVTRLALAQSGELAASGSSDGVVRVWNTRTGRRSPGVLRHPAGPIEALAFSPDERWLVSADSNSVRVFELESGDLVREIAIEGQPLAIAVSAASDLIAIGDSAGNIYLAVPDSGAGVEIIRGRSAITALAFGATRERLTSGSDDGDLVLWDTETAAAIDPARRFPGPIRWIELAEDATVWLQSGVWLHRLDRSVDPHVIVASRLLPEPLRPEPALALLDGGRVRALANRGGGRLALADLELGPTSAGGALPDRDLGRVLALTLDTATGVVRWRYP